MKKIVIVQDYLRNGGTERQSVHLARQFAAAGHDMTLLTFRPGGVLAPSAAPTAQSQISADRQRHSAHCKFQSLQPFDTHLDWFAPRLIATLRRISPDIVLCMGRMANCKAGHIARALPRAVVISTMRTGKKLPRAYIRSLHATRHTIANSHEVARILRGTHGLPEEKITVIHNAVVHDDNSNSDSGTGCQPVSAGAPLETPGSPASSAFSPSVLQPFATPLRLLCVAMFRPEKNHNELLDLLARIPATLPWTLDLLGDGPELELCVAHARRLRIDARVCFHGFVAEPAPYYDCAHVAVLVSRSESLPNFLVEAHANGIPSVAYAVGGVAECGGIAIPPGDQKAFLAALARLAGDPAHYVAEVTRVTAHARKHFSRQGQLRRYLDLFEKLTA